MIRALSRRAAAATLVSALAGAGVAAGQVAPIKGAPVFAFDLPAQPASETVIAIGLKAGLSILNSQACRGASPPLHGRYTAREALARTLAAAPCRLDFLDASTVRLTVRAAPTPRAVAAAPKPPPAKKPAPPAGDDAVSDLVVTAQKRRQSILEVAGPVTVVGGTQLTDTEAKDIRDVSLGLAALVLTNLGPGRDKVLLRGVSDGAFTGRARATVITYLDDAPVTYNAPDPDLVLTDVDRVEILRGPQGALYGGGSIGGVYRIVTKAPQLDDYAGALTLRGSTTRSGANGGGAEALFNAPLITGALALRASAYQLDEGGYLQDDVNRRSNVDRTVRSGARVALLGRPKDDWSVTLSGAYQHLATADTQYTTLPGGALRRANLVRESHKSNFASGGLVVDGDLGFARLHAATSYVQRDFSSVYDASAALDLFDAPAAEFGFYDETVHSRLITQDIYAYTPDSRTLSWLVGAYASRQISDSPSVLMARVRGSTIPQLLFAEQRHDSVEELALYGDARLRLGPGWTATIGARAFRNAVAVTSTAQTPTQPVRTNTSDNSLDHLGVSPKISLEYAWSPGSSAYVLASSGERPGGFNSGGLRPVPDRMRYAPDRLENYEAGVKARGANGGWEASATVFHDRWRALQTDQFYASGLPYTANVGDGRLTGLEAEAAVRPAPGLTFGANLLLTQSRLVNAAPAFARNLKGGLPGSPDAAFVLTGAYERRLWRDLSLLLAGQAGYSGRSHLTFDTTGANTTSSSYVDTKLSAQLHTLRHRLTLAVTNPQDSQANTFAYGNPFSFGQVRQVTPQRPRTLELTASTSF